MVGEYRGASPRRRCIASIATCDFSIDGTVRVEEVNHMSRKVALCSAANSARKSSVSAAAGSRGNVKELLAVFGNQ